VRRVYEEHGSLTLFRLSQTRFEVFFWLFMRFGRLGQEGIEEMFQQAFATDSGVVHELEEAQVEHRAISSRNNNPKFYRNGRLPAHRDLQPFGNEPVKTEGLVRADEIVRVSCFLVAGGGSFCQSTSAGATTPVRKPSARAASCIQNFAKKRVTEFSSTSLCALPVSRQGRVFGKLEGGLSPSV